MLSRIVTRLSKASLCGSASVLNRLVAGGVLMGTAFSISDNRHNASLKNSMLNLASSFNNSKNEGGDNINNNNNNNNIKYNDALLKQISGSIGTMESGISIHTIHFEEKVEGKYLFCCKELMTSTSHYLQLHDFENFDIQQANIKETANKWKLIASFTHDKKWDNLGYCGCMFVDWCNFLMEELTIAPNLLTNPKNIAAFLIAKQSSDIYLALLTKE